MREYIRFKRRLAELTKQQKRLGVQYEGAQRDHHGKADDGGYLQYLGHDLWALEGEIAYCKTAYLKAEADRLMIPMPDRIDKSMYEEIDLGDADGPMVVLTTEGAHYLREKIRSEKKAHREVVTFYFGIAIGLIGAISGLVSVITK